MKKRKVILNPPYFDDEERDIIEAYKRGEFKPVQDQKAFKEMACRAAENHIRKRKEARVNLRMSEFEIDQFKKIAEEEGLPYQTFISSLLHKYLKGRLVETPRSVQL
jgi:predicted DNA binding CopG/RHH family protein